LLRSGATKSVFELLQPFGLDATEETFWADGIRVSLEAMISEAEKLAPVQVGATADLDEEESRA
jgi:oligoendopeptidase F